MKFKVESTAEEQYCLNYKHIIKGIGGHAGEGLEVK